MGGGPMGGNPMGGNPMGGRMPSSPPGAAPTEATKRAGLGRGALIAIVAVILVTVVGVGVVLSQSGIFGAASGVADSYSLTATVGGWVDNDTGCAFKSDGYHITKSVICYAPSNDLGDGTASVTITQVSGDASLTYGMVFHRVSAGNFSTFQIDSQGNYALTKVVNETASDPLAHGTNKAIAKGAGAKNTLAVQIKGSHITLLVNGTQVGAADDATFRSGKTGLVGYDGLDVAFTDFKIQR
jgi:VCBS repeat-containing protein